MSEEINRDHKLIIIGSGPAGLTAAIYGARAGLNPLVAAGSAEGTKLPGGQLMLTTDVENFPGFPEGIQGPDLMMKMMDQARRFGAEIIEEDVVEVDLKPGGPFKVKLQWEGWFEAQALIIATGASARWLNLPSEEKFKGKGVSACATCDGPLPMFRDKHLIVVGGGDSAIEEALFLTKFASKVTIVHRRDKLRASHIMQQKAFENPKIDFIWDTVLVDYYGDEVLEGVILKNVKTGETKKMPVGGVFIAIGHDPNTKFLQGSGLEIDEKGYIKVKNVIETNIPGVFAAGDVHDYYYRQAITAAGFGAMAAIRATRWLETGE